MQHHSNLLANLLFCAFTLALSSCRSSESTQNTNHLLHEKSPYLQQHAKNPVWWYPWNKEAFDEAKKQHKPILISIGYSTCHWCHVMETESFSDEEVARALNQTAIAIKVDKEERPDLDARYLKAVQTMTGTGGWPLNVFLTPEGDPFFGGVYFSKKELLEILAKIHERWKTEPEKIVAEAKELQDWFREQEKQGTTGRLSDPVFSTFLQRFKANYDPVNGGLQGSPKFPPSSQLRLLLRIAHRTGDRKALGMVTTTLDHMAQGGIHDALAGGFHRYATDERWQIPHFEKMLYDQASLAETYLEAFQLTGKKEYALITRETLDFVLRDLTSPEGAFFSALDADNTDGEGRYYTWNYDELKGALSASEFGELFRNFVLSPQGNFEDHQIVLRQTQRASIKNRSALLQGALLKLNTLREKRIHPGRDEKILTSWNSLMIAALAKAGSVLGEKRYLDAAEKAAFFLLSKNRAPDGHLFRRWVSGEAGIAGFLEDYAFLVDALIELFQATSDPRWLGEARTLQRVQSEQLGPSPSESYEDRQLPSGNSIAALNLLRLSAFFYSEDYEKKARLLLDSAPERARTEPGTFSGLLASVDFQLHGAQELVVIAPFHQGPELERVRKEFLRDFQPNRVMVFWKVSTEASSTGNATPPIPLLKGKKPINGKITYYVCIRRLCKFPTTDLKKAITLAKEQHQ